MNRSLRVCGVAASMGLMLWPCMLLAAPRNPIPRPAAAATAREYAAAEQAFQGGDLARAEELYSALIKTYGDEPTAWFRIGLMAQRRDAFKPALYAYDSALASAPADASEEIAQVLAKVRFNRAILLLESAAKDLRDIAPGALEPGRDAMREALTARLDIAMREADLPVPAERGKSAAAPKTSSRGYLYEAAMPAARTPGVAEQRP